MLYRLFISTEAGVSRLCNHTAESTTELLSQIQSGAKHDDIVQVVIFEQLAPVDGRTPLAKVGSCAGYYNSNHGFVVDMLDNFNVTGYGMQVNAELNRLAKEQHCKQRSA